jgi:hypothetical protein
MASILAQIWTCLTWLVLVLWGVFGLHNAAHGQNTIAQNADGSNVHIIDFEGGELREVRDGIWHFYASNKFGWGRSKELLSSDNVSLKVKASNPGQLSLVKKDTTQSPCRSDGEDIVSASLEFHMNFGDTGLSQVIVKETVDMCEAVSFWDVLSVRNYTLGSETKYQVWRVIGVDRNDSSSSSEEEICNDPSNVDCSINITKRPPSWAGKPVVAKIGTSCSALDGFTLNLPLGTYETHDLTNIAGFPDNALMSIQLDQGYEMRVFEDDLGVGRHELY